MAGERKGKTYEALVMVALSELDRRGKLPGKVFWNHLPQGMSIEPDFTIGNDENHPEIILLITHSGAAGNSHMKFWRNIGELLEAKTRLATVPRVYTIAFDSIIKSDLKKLQYAAFDGQLIVGDSKYGKALLAWTESNSEKLPKDGKAKAEAISTIINSTVKGNDLQNLLNQLTQDIGNIISYHRAELDHLWEMERVRSLGKSRPRKITYMRRGIGKFLLLQPPYSSALTRDGRLRVGTPENIVRALEKMELSRRAIGGTRVSDPEMLWVINNLKPNTIDKICEAQPLSQMSELIEALLSLGEIEAQVKYISEHWDELITPLGLYKHLKSCHKNPTAILSKGSTSETRRVWLYHDLLEWIKLAGKTRTSYGLARLTADIDEAANDPNHQSEVASLVQGRVEWRSAETIVRLGLVDWHSAPSKQHFPLYDDDLARVTVALARRLRECPRPDPQNDTEHIVKAIVQTNLEAKLLTYRHLQPIETALALALEKAGFLMNKLTYTKACFAQLAEADGAKLDPRSAGTSVIGVKNTIINWQSAHGSHTGDKTKELCGRAVALRYSWSAEMSKFVPRPSVKKLILVVDGTWRQEELDALIRAGWDEIFYPDEMDDLVATIV